MPFWSFSIQDVLTWFVNLLYIGLPFELILVMFSAGAALLAFFCLKYLNKLSKAMQPFLVFIDTKPSTTVHIYMGVATHRNLHSSAISLGSSRIKQNILGQ